MIRSLRTATFHTGMILLSLLWIGPIIWVVVTSTRSFDDIATNGMELIRDIVAIYDNYEFTTEILVASCRHPIHVVEAAKMGADIATCPPAVIDALFNHPLTAIGLEKFLKDWEKAQAVKA